MPRLYAPGDPLDVPAAAPAAAPAGAGLPQYQHHSEAVARAMAEY